MGHWAADVIAVAPGAEHQEGEGAQKLLPPPQFAM
jgi:hypothetical protein